MISSSNFVAIAQLVVLARKDPRTASPFSSLLDPVTLTCTLFPLRAFFKKDEYKEGKFHRRMPHYELQGNFPHSPSVFVTVTAFVNVRFSLM